jgi:hypothetical protein
MDKLLSTLKSLGKGAAQIINEIGLILREPQYLLILLGITYLLVQMVNIIAGWPHITLYQTLVITFLMNIYISVKK